MRIIRFGLAGLLFSGALTALNAHGVFERERPGPEIVAPTPPRDLPANAPVRIVLLGTSLTSRGVWPDALARRLEACASRPVSVRRIARAGANSGWGLRALAAALDPPPEILIAEFSINDASLYHGVSLTQSRNHLDRIIETALAAGSRVYLATMNPAWGREALERPGQAAYRNLYRERADAYRIGLIDTIAAWRKLNRAQREAAAPDALHPTDAAMTAIVVRAMTRALSPAICGGRGATGVKG